MLAIYRHTASVRLKANYISQRIYREKVNKLIRETNTQESLLKRDGIITTICHRRKRPRTKLFSWSVYVVVMRNIVACHTRASE